MIPVARDLPFFRDSTQGFRLSVLGVAFVTVGVAALLYFGIPVLLLPAILAGILLSLVTLRAPTLGLSLVIAAQYVPVEVGGFTILQELGFLVAVLSLIWYGASKKGFVVPNIVLPILVLFLITLYSFTFTRSVEVTDYMLRKLVLNAVFCLLLVNLVDTYAKIRLPLWVVAGMGVINSLVAAFQVVVGSTTEFRARGLQENENALGAFAAMAFAVPFYYFLYADRTWKRVIGLALSAVLCVGVVTSVSRGAVLSLLGGMCFIMFREKRYRLRLALLIGLALTFYPLLPSYFHHRFQSIGSEVRGTIFVGQRRGLSSRGYYNRAGIKIWEAHPVLGVGLGNYGYYFAEPEFNPGVKASSHVPAHNIYIQALAETGTVGFVVLCWWILQSVLNYRVAERRTNPDPNLRLYLRASETLTVVTLLDSFSMGSLAYTYLSMALAMSYVCRRCAENQAWLDTRHAA